MKLWLLWREGDDLLGIFDSESGANGALLYASRITVQRDDGTTFRPYDAGLEVEMRNDINAFPVYRVSPGDGCRVVQSRDIQLEQHGPKTQQQNAIDNLMHGIEMDLFAAKEP